MSFTRYRWGRRLLLLAGMLGLALAAPAHANPVPFQARYQLSIAGWPDVQIKHRLSRQGELWQSEMSAAIAIAEGKERSRFRLDEHGIKAQSYTGAYRMLGIGKRYRLASAELTELPDRQAALFALSRRAADARCRDDNVAPCTLRYLDHKGEAETLRYRVTGHGEIALPAGRFSGISVDAWDPQFPGKQTLTRLSLAE